MICGHGCLSVRMEQLGSHWTDFLEIWRLRTLRKSGEKIRFALKSDKNKRYFTRGPMYTYDNTSQNSSKNGIFFSGQNF